jgi:hypothetical protein
LRDQEERREYGRKIDAANLAAEQTLNPRTDLPTVNLKLDAAPKTSPHVKAYEAPRVKDYEAGRKIK